MLVLWCDVSLIILAHFPKFMIFVHNAPQTFVILGVLGGLVKKADVAPVFDVPFLLFPQERADIHEYLQSDCKGKQYDCRKP